MGSSADRTVIKFLKVPEGMIRIRLVCQGVDSGSIQKDHFEMPPQGPDRVVPKRAHGILERIYRHRQTENFLSRTLLVGPKGSFLYR